MARDDMADPRPGVAKDLEIYSRMVKELVGEGVLAATILDAERALQDENYDAAEHACLLAGCMVRGVANLGKNRLPTAVVAGEEPACDWTKLEERARICSHNLHRLPSLLRDYQKA